MMDDTNALTADEAKYFESGGKADLPEAPPAEETPADQPKVETVEKAPEAEKKAPAEIEVVEDDDGEGEPDARKYVKVGVLRKEREKAKEFRNSLAQTQQQLAALRQQVEAAKAPPREIAPEEAGQVALQRLQQIEADQQNHVAKTQFIGAYQRAATDYAKEQTDFPAAYQHALGIRRGMYELAGYQPHEVNALLESEEAAIVERAFQSGENPAKKLYEIAKTLGYKPADPAAKDEPKVKTDADKVLESAEKLAKIQKGMEKNKSVTGAGSADSAPSLADLADMDDAEFEKATSGKKWKELMGG